MDIKKLAPWNWFKPTLDIGASDKEDTISIELPGVDEKDVQLELTSGTLKIKGGSSWRRVIS